MTWQQEGRWNSTTPKAKQARMGEVIGVWWRSILFTLWLQVFKVLFRDSSTFCLFLQSPCCDMFFRRFLLLIGLKVMMSFSRSYGDQAFGVSLTRKPQVFGHQHMVKQLGQTLGVSVCGGFLLTLWPRQVKATPQTKTKPRLKPNPNKSKPNPVQTSTKQKKHVYIKNKKSKSSNRALCNSQPVHIWVICASKRRTFQKPIGSPLLQHWT